MSQHDTQRAGRLLPGQASSEQGEPAALPYFDLLLERLSQGDGAFAQAFGRHVHWGYWPDPDAADGSATDFAAAAERLSERLITAAAIVGGERVLDAGCGFGGTLARLDALASDLELTGLNIDPRQLERAATLVPARACNRIRWIAADACAMPLTADSLDAVLAVECIFHFPSRAAFFAECARVLRPGGRLVLCDFVPTTVLRLLQRCGSGAGGSVRAVYGRVDTTCTLGGYRRLARRHGMRLRLNDDITASTLPTYAVVERLLASAGWPEGAAATRAIARLSRSGLLRYRILAFDNGPGSAISSQTP